MKRLVLLLIVGLVALYTLPGAILFFLQDQLVFPAPSVSRAELDREASAWQAEVIELHAADGTQLYGWHRPAGGTRAVIFFHGNAEVVWGRPDLQRMLVDHGWDVLVIAYRGYPGSEGAPSEAGLLEDAHAVWRYATETLAIPADKLVLHGKSLGGGVAGALATEVTPAALVLESTFLSIPDVAAGAYPFYPVRWLLWTRFPTAERAPSIACPVLVLHGGADPMIDPSHGRTLATRFPDARYVEVPGAGHGETLPVVDGQAQVAYLELLQSISSP